MILASAGVIPPLSPRLVSGNEGRICRLGIIEIDLPSKSLGGSRSSPQWYPPVGECTPLSLVEISDDLTVVVVLQRVSSMLVAATKQASVLDGLSALEAAGGAPAVAGGFQDRRLNSGCCALSEMLHEPEKAVTYHVLIPTQLPSAEFLPDLALRVVVVLSHNGFGYGNL